MNVYISAPSEMRPTAQSVRRYLQLHNITVVSRWLDGDGEFKNIPDDKTQAGMESIKNFEDLDQCEIFLALNPDAFRYKGSGGRHVELGYAIAQDMRVVIYGDKTCVFHYLPGIIHIEDPGDFLKAIQSIIAGEL